jgi:hypothetical protein
MHANVASGYCYATLFGPLTLVPLITYDEPEMNDKESRVDDYSHTRSIRLGPTQVVHCIFQVLLVRCARLDQLRRYRPSDMCRTWTSDRCSNGSNGRNRSIAVEANG